MDEEKKPIKVAVVGLSESETKQADAFINALRHKSINDVIMVNENSIMPPVEIVDPLEKKEPALVDSVSGKVAEMSEHKKFKMRKVYNRILKKQKQSFICENAVEVLKKLNRKAKHNKNKSRKQKIREGNQRANLIAKMHKNINTLNLQTSI